MKNITEVILLFSFFMLTLSVLGQSSSNLHANGDIFQKLESNEEGSGEIVIFQDMRVNELMYHSVEQNKQNGKISGFRIRIFSNLGNNAREESQAIKTRFYELFPEISIHREYESPYFKVYVGDYRTKIDALKDFKRIEKYFPSAFIVPSKINFPDLED